MHNWTGDNQYPPNWKQLKQLTAERASNQCQDFMSDGTRCPDRGTECDHIISIKAGGTHNLDNLQLLCKWHHKRKTSREAQNARTPISMYRKPEQHPGWK